MRDVFITDNSIFEDALTDSGNPDYKESSQQLINAAFKYKLDGKTICYIPEEAYSKFLSHFTKLGKTQAIALISNIVQVAQSSQSSHGQMKISVTKAITNLAYKFTLIPDKAYLVTNNQKNYQELLKSDRLFYVINSNEAIKILNHPNFLS